MLSVPAIQDSGIVVLESSDLLVVMLTGGCYVETTWGAMKYVRQNEPGLLGETGAAVITKARDMYGKAVEASLEAASNEQAGVVGDTVRQAFAQVGRIFTANAGRRVHSLNPHLFIVDQQCDSCAGSGTPWCCCLLLFARVSV